MTAFGKLNLIARVRLWPMGDWLGATPSASAGR